MAALSLYLHRRAWIADVLLTIHPSQSPVGAEPVRQAAVGSASSMHSTGSREQVRGTQGPLIIPGVLCTAQQDRQVQGWVPELVTPISPWPEPGTSQHPWVCPPGFWDCHQGTRL